MIDAEPHGTRPPKLPVERQVAAALWRCRWLIAVELIVAVFEATLFASGILNAFAAVLLFPLGLLLYAIAMGLMRLASGRSWSLRFGMRHLMLFVVVAAVAFQLMRTFGWSLATLLVVMTPPVVGVVTYLLLSNGRSTQQDALISVLAMAAHRKMPLGPAARAYAGLCGGDYRQRVESLASRLDAGEILPDAVDRVPGVLPGDATALARAGWESGKLAPALDEAASSRAARQRDTPPTRSLIAYPLLVVLFTLTSANFLMVFMISHYDALLSDMNLKPPEPSRTVFEVLRPASRMLRGVGGNWVGSLLVSFGLAIPEFLVLMAVLFGGVWILKRVVRDIGESLDHVAGAAVGQRPLASRLASIRLRRDAATILRALSLGVDGGRPLPDVLASLGRRDLGFGSRWRVRKVQADVIRGRDWIASMHNRGLIQASEAAVLVSARRAGNLGWALRERADAVERRLNHRLQAWGQVLQPLAIVVLGLLVLLFALVYFHPLVAMIAQQAEEVV